MSTSGTRILLAEKYTGRHLISSCGLQSAAALFSNLHFKIALLINFKDLETALRILCIVQNMKSLENINGTLNEWVGNL